MFCSVSIYGLLLNLAHSDSNRADPTKPLKGMTKTETVKIIPTNIPANTVVIPDEKKEAIESSFLLTAIIISGDTKTAVLNDKAVKEGDIIEGNVVQHIGMDSVILKKEGYINAVKVIYLLNTYADIKGRKNEKQ